MQHLRKLIALKKILDESKQQQNRLKQQKQQMAEQDIRGKIDDLDSAPDFSGDLPRDATLCWENAQTQAPPVEARSERVGEIHHQ